MKKNIFRSILVAVCFCLMLGSATAAEQKSGDNDKTVNAETLFAAMLLNAEKGQAQAMLNLGILYEQGLGAARNFTKALEWYEKAAFAGERDGWLRMGLCYEVGMGTTADMAKAVKNYEKASLLGSPQAQHKMASLYILGRGVPKDEGRGFTLLKKAAESGDGAAANELAVVYLKGMLGQKLDAAKAREWFLKSADRGNLEGVKNLAVMLKDGIGQAPDPAGALRWYLIAQKGGLQAPDIEDVINDLKKNLQAAQVQKAEADAGKWLAEYAARMTKTSVK